MHSIAALTCIALLLLAPLTVSAQTAPRTAVGGGATPQVDGAPRIVNIINFVRKCEPRIGWITEDVLYETVVEQIACMKRHGLTGTFLLQYDALVEPRYQKLLRGLLTDGFEIGAWWEIPQPLVEDSGYEWRGRYPWDWHADVGFATGYSPAEREKLADTYMAAFKTAFGRFPQSVGSWFIDAHTLRYLHDRYGITASCNCKDQIGTDGYTLWGGYWNQGYYPSRKNAYMPAQSAAGQIPVPVFRMLGSDPIHQYDSGLGSNRQRVISLEPIYDPGGSNPAWCDWYFDAFVNGECMDFAYTQAGQENSFTWKRMGRGFEMQMQRIARLRADGKVTTRTLGATGRWFKERYDVTPPTSVTVLDDHAETQQKTVWFNSRFYRANLLWDRGTLRFRDIHLFDERQASDYLTRRGTSTRCLFETLPIVDGFRWSSTDTVAGLRLKRTDGKPVVGGTPEVKQLAKGQLTVRWPTRVPAGELVLVLDEATLQIAATGELADGWRLELTCAAEATLPFEEVAPAKLTCRSGGVRYAVLATHGVFQTEASAPLGVLPRDGRIRLDFSKR